MLKKDDFYITRLILFTVTYYLPIPEVLVKSEE
jgi:hypothetical protein